MSLRTLFKRLSNKINQHSKAQNMDDTIPAVAAVLSTAELLENILSFLPINDIFETYMAHRCFHDTIKSSIKLKRLLFLAPESHLLYGVDLSLNPFLDMALEDLDFELKGHGLLDTPSPTFTVEFRRGHRMPFNRKLEHLEDYRAKTESFYQTILTNSPATVEVTINRSRAKAPCRGEGCCPPAVRLNFEGCGTTLADLRDKVLERLNSLQS